MIADSDHGRDNNYHVLRFIAASLVIVGHSFYLSTAGGKEPLKMLTGYKHFGEVGVLMFFVISGFLVTKSFLSRRDLSSYLEARILRIFPALAVAVIFAVLVVGPVATTLPLTDYFSDRQTVRHLVNNVTLTTPEWNLPGVFATNPWKNAVNGSLWSLFTEVRLYLLVGLLGVIGLLAPRSVCNTVVVSVVLLGIYFPGALRVLVLALNTIHVGVSSAFAFGALCYINRDVVPMHWGVVVILGAAATLLHGTASFPFAFDLALAYSTLFLAYAPSPRWIRGLNGTGDYSYGIYLYAFPIQQLIAWFIPTVTALPMAVLAFVGTLPLAVLSWHLIEKPSLDAKGTVAPALARAGRRVRDRVIAWRSPAPGRPPVTRGERETEQR